MVCCHQASARSFPSFRCKALLGLLPSPDQTEIPFFDPTPLNFNLHDFSEQYPLQMDLPISPGVYSPQSLPSTPFRYIMILPSNRAYR